MGKITNRHIIKIKELISDEVCMGTYGLVELELLEMEKDLINAPQKKAHNSDYAKCPCCGEPWHIRENNSCSCGAFIAKLK